MSKSDLERALADIQISFHRPWLGVVKITLWKDHQSVVLELSEAQIRQAAPLFVEAMCERLKAK